jgi:4-carboxymuconolactone decarboxylase
MERFPVLGKGDLDEAQRALWDELTLGPRGFYTGGAEAERLPDLYNAWLQFPEFGELMMRLGDVVRTRAKLPGRLRELIVLTTSAMLGARVEFDFHVPFAQNEGLSDALIAAIAERRGPPFADDLERVTYEATTQLLRQAVLTHDTREEAIALLGYRGLTEVIACATLYVATAYTTNVARVKLADVFAADPQMLKDFFAGKPGAD